MTQRIRTWIGQHDLEAFFLLAIGFSFALLFPARLLFGRDDTLGQILGLLLGRIGVYSPVLAGMLVAHLNHPNREHAPTSRRVIVFVAVWLIAAAVHTASLQRDVEPGTPLIAVVILSLPVALLPAFVIASAFSRSGAIRQLLSTLVRPRGSIVIYLIALLTFPLIHIVGTVVTNAVNGDRWLPQVTRVGDLVLLALTTFLSVLLFSGGINEESGWRGFAQKRLQARASPLVANLVLWILLVVWHIPNDIVQYRHGGYLLVRFGLYPCITILFGWLYNRTEGSTMAPALAHAAMNTMNPLVHILPITPVGNALLVGLTVAVVVADRMWRKLPGDHGAVHRGSDMRDDPDAHGLSGGQAKVSPRRLGNL